MRERLSSRGRTLGDVSTIALLALVLALPLGGRGLDPAADSSVLAEQRMPAPLPALPRSLERAGTFPARFKAWLDDSFAFRSQLVRWHNALKIYGFRVAPTQRAVLGPDRWVFTTANKSFEAYRGSFRLSDRELELWRIVLEARRDWLAERDIAYVFCFAPMKPTLYPEQLPAGYMRGPETTLEQLRAYLAQHSDFEILDLHGPLLEAKQADTPGNEVYYQLGTHWTERGGFIATRAIFASLRSALPGFLLPVAEDYVLRGTHDAGDSWASRFHIPDLLLQQRISFAPAAGWSTVLTGREGKDLGTRTHDVDQGPRLLLLHDSFGEALWPFLAEQFSHSFSHGGFEIDPDLVELVRPDVVVQVMAERRLESYPPADALSGTGAVARQAFEDAPRQVLRLDDAASLAALEPWAGAQFAWAAAADEEAPLEVHCRGGDQGFLLPSLELPPEGSPVLRVDLTSNVATTLSVRYLTQAEDEYGPGRAVDVALRQGRNQLNFYLPAGRVEGRLLVLPRRRRGRYAIHSIELRSTR